MILLAVIIVLLCIAIALFYRHQSLLKDRAQLMRDAMRHRDFAFRLPTKGLPFGEKALQEALNDMGQDIQKLVAHNEVEAWQRLTRVLTHEIMNATTPIRSISQAFILPIQTSRAHLTRKAYGLFMTRVSDLRHSSTVIAS